MQPEYLVWLAIIGAALQVMIQFLGVIKAWVEFLTAREKAKGSDKETKSKPKKKKPK